ncbi:MAG: hypothetical protein R3B13_09220 [Polyangiaceae bacterium]
MSREQLRVDAPLLGNVDEAEALAALRAGIGRQAGSRQRQRLPSLWEHQLGQFEGIAWAFGAPGHVTVETLEPTNYRFIVEVA